MRYAWLNLKIAVMAIIGLILIEDALVSMVILFTGASLLFFFSMIFMPAWRVRHHHFYLTCYFLIFLAMAAVHQTGITP